MGTRIDGIMLPNPARILTGLTRLAGQALPVGPIVPIKLRWVVGPLYEIIDATSPNDTPVYLLGKFSGSSWGFITNGDSYWLVTCRILLTGVESIEFIEQFWQMLSIDEVESICELIGNGE